MQLHGELHEDLSCCIQQVFPMQMCLIELIQVQNSGTSDQNGSEHVALAWRLTNKQQLQGFSCTHDFDFFLP